MIDIPNFQPDSINIVSPGNQVADTLPGDIDIVDTLKVPEILPLPEERQGSAEVMEPVEMAPRISIEEQQRRIEEQKQKEYDSLQQQALKELKEPVIDFHWTDVRKIKRDTNYFQNEVKHELKSSNLLNYNKFSPDWIFGVLLLSSFIIIVIRLSYNKYWRLILKSIHNYQFSYKLYKDSSVLYTQLSYLLNLNSAIVVGLFFYQFIRFSGIQSFLGFKGFGIYLILPAILLGLYILQYMAYNFIGTVTLRVGAAKEYLHHSLLLNKILGLTFIPVTLGISYLPDQLRGALVYTGIFLIILVYLKRIQRGFIILNKNHVLKFYRILYFCTLEILPVLIMVKLLISFY